MYSQKMKADVIAAYYQGSTITELSKKYGISQMTVRRWITPKPQEKAIPFKKERFSVGKVLMPHVRELLMSQYRARIHSVTAAVIYGELKKIEALEGLNFSQKTVSRIVQRYKQEIEQEIEQERAKNHLKFQADPGSAQVDFGFVNVLHNKKDIKLVLLALAFPYSNMRYGWLLPANNFECFAYGLQRLFTDVGGVPHTLHFDKGNIDSTGAKSIFKDNYQKFRQYFHFKDEFCNSASGNEQGSVGSVERAVSFLRNRFFGEAQPFDGDFEARNLTLLDEVKLLEDDIRPNTDKTIRELFEVDRQHLLELPAEPFEAFSTALVTPDRYGCIRFDGQLYQVTHDSRRQMLVRATWNQIKVYEYVLSAELSMLAPVPNPEQNEEQYMAPKTSTTSIKLVATLPRRYDNLWTEG